MTDQSEILNDPKYRAVLDHGFVGLKDHMGDDSAIVQAARVSYAKGTKSVNEDKGLIRYLLRHRHSTPFEMVEFKFHIRIPIFVARQWIRHRTASVNEESARYSEMTDQFYIPNLEDIQPQSDDNKQGRAGELSEKDRAGAQWFMEAACDHAHQSYKVLLGDRIGNDPENPGFDVLYDPYREDGPMLTSDFPGTAREIARIVMPLASYTEMYWKIDLHNLMHFLRLRADGHAQKEIRVFAETMIDLIRPIVPVAMEAFDDYVRGALNISRMERELLRDLLTSVRPPDDKLDEMIRRKGGIKEFALSRGMSVRELRQFRDEFGI
jgi:thymidylate synthase (FAD)